MPTARNGPTRSDDVVTFWTPVVDGGPLVRSRWIYNCYVIPGAANGHPLVVDVGLVSHSRALTPWIADSPVVLATHLHSDHVGGIPDLCERSDAVVMLPDRGRAYRAGETPRSPGLGAIAKIWPVLRSQRCQPGAIIEPLTAPKVGYGLFDYTTPATDPVYVEDGQAIEAAEGWTVIGAPGHTDDSTCYYHAGSRTLISGDAVLSVGGRAWFNPEYVDAELSGETEDRLRSLRVDVLLVGHGHPVVGRDVLADAHSFRTRLGWIPSARSALGRRHRTPDDGDREAPTNT